MRELVRELALALRDEVVPHLGSHVARTHTEGGTGDVTFAIDAAAEALLRELLPARAPGMALYSEHSGFVPAPSGAPDAVLIVDPVDGTRPALAGLESCCVSIAAAPWRDEPAIGDVTVGCVVEIPSGVVFLAERGAGLVEGPPVRLSANERLERMFWTYGFRGRPARPTTEVLAELIDVSSVGGATFELGSAAFDATRVVTGQLDAYVEPGPLLVDEVPGMRAEFERVGGGAVLNNAPYDVAASVLIAEEAGALVTDARGRSLAERPLLGAGAEHQVSIVVAANHALHRQIVAAVADGVHRLTARAAGDP